MKKKILLYGDPILRKKGRPIKEITPEIRQLVNDMIETMKQADGIGLAAPQIGESLLLFITESPRWDEEKQDWESHPIRVWINPRVLEISSETWDHSEGCLSIPGINGVVRRPFRIVVEAMDLEGNIFRETLEGWPARTFLHENDHIHGVLYIDRITGKTRQEMEPQLKAIKKKKKF